jgi:predicted Zn-dependent protease
MMDEYRATEILEMALSLADAEAVEVILGGGREGVTRFADNAITQNVEREDLGLTVSCAYGAQHAAASTNDVSDDSVKAAVERAQEAAKVSPPDPEYVPPVPPGERDRYQQVGGYHHTTRDAGPDARAVPVSRITNLVRARKFRVSGAFSCAERFFSMANSRGLRAYYPSTLAETHVTVLGENGSGWAQKVANNIEDIDLSQVAAEAIRIAGSAQNPADIPPGKYTVILRPAAVEELIPGIMICDAKATDEERTFLRGKMGEQICGENITIRSDPADPRCPARPFQHDGLTSPKLAWVEKGILKNLATSRYWAKKTKRHATGWPSNVIIDGGDTTIEDMIASTERGLVVTRFWYIRYVEPMESLMTGMTRDGLFLIENGKVNRPVKNLRFNESVLGVLNRVESLGPCERVGTTLVPTMKVRDFNFTSATKF